jgi:hypothetical protein
MHVVVLQLFLTVFEQIQWLLVVLVGLFKFILEGEVDSWFETQIEG